MSANAKPADNTPTNKEENSDAVRGSKSRFAWQEGDWGPAEDDDEEEE